MGLIREVSTHKTIPIIAPKDMAGYKQCQAVHQNSVQHHKLQKKIAYKTKNSMSHPCDSLSLLAVFHIKPKGVSELGALRPHLFSKIQRRLFLEVLINDPYVPCHIEAHKK